MDLNTIIRSENAASIQLVVNAKDLRDLLDGAIAFAMQEIKQANEPEYYTREEVQDMLHVSAPTLLEWREKGLMPEPAKIAGRVLYDKAEVHKAIKAGKIKIKAKN